MRDEIGVRAADAGAAADVCPRVAVLFESNPFAAAEIDALIGRAVAGEVSFIGIVSSLGRETSFPLHRLLQAAGAPVHFFPGTLHPCLLRALRESSNIQVLGRGSDPRADLLAHLERTGQFDHLRTTGQQAVA